MCGSTLSARPQQCRFAQSAQFLRFYNLEHDAAFEDGEKRILPCKVQCKHCGTWVADEGRNMFMAFPTLFCFNKGPGGRLLVPPSFQPSARIFCSTRVLDSIDNIPGFRDDLQTPQTISDFLRYVAPKLDGSSHKGQAGRIGVLGGSPDYTGAPYYAGMAALRVGAELLYMLTAEEACAPIKAYSPELMVSAVYKSWIICEGINYEEEIERFVANVDAVLPRLHALVIGPGLGRHPHVLMGVALIIENARRQNIPLVIDADGLWLITESLHLLRGYQAAVLTPNKMEYRRLAVAACGREDVTLPELVCALGGPTVVQKGPVDLICSPGLQPGCLEGMEAPLEVAEESSPRRPGGIGDLLAGTVAVIFAWSRQVRSKDIRRACEAACVLVRRACQQAYAKKKRAMMAPDVLDELGDMFDAMCPAPPVGAMGD